MKTELSDRAAAFEHDVETHLVDPHGLLMSALDIETMAPFSPGYFAGKSIHDYPGHTWSDFGEFMHYENVGMCSGAYLAAMVWKYRACKDPGAWDNAYRTFQGIRYLFDLSQATDEGFYCKCYGGKASEQISTDQYVYTLAGLNEFLSIAGAKERVQIVEMIGKMASFWIRKNYSYPYYGEPLTWPLERFPGLMWLAYHHTGDLAFRAEFDRLNAIPGVMEKLPHVPQGGTLADILKNAGEREAWIPIEEESGLRVISLVPETAQTGFVCIAPLLEFKAPHRENWLRTAWQLYDIHRSWIAGDGRAMHYCLYNPKTGELKEVNELLHDPVQATGQINPFRDIIAPKRSGMWSAMFARACVGIQPYFPDQPMLADAFQILHRLTRDRLNWKFYMNHGANSTVPEEMQWCNAVYSGDAATHWLWTYWQAAATYGIDWENRFPEKRTGSRKDSIAAEYPAGGVSLA